MRGGPVVGLVAGLVALAWRPGLARAAWTQDWPPFALVAGLLAIGLVARDDGLFEWWGARMGAVSRHGRVVYAVSGVAVVVVTALLNLDTAVAFMTPILVHAARHRREPVEPWLYATVVLANAGSLWLPGSNLTNLIVLGHLRMSGMEFVQRTVGVALVASVVGVLTVSLLGRRDLGAFTPPEPVVPLRGRLGPVATAAALALILVSRSPALPVVAVAAIAVAVRAGQHRLDGRELGGTLAPLSLAGLLGVAVALGTLGRASQGIDAWLGHQTTIVTALVAAVATVLVNNLPAASVLAAHPPAHPVALLVGLNLGPNLFVTGSLAWLLWWRSARAVGVEPRFGRAVTWGVVVGATTVASAVLVLAL